MEFAKMSLFRLLKLLLFLAFPFFFSILFSISSFSSSSETSYQQVDHIRDLSIHGKTVKRIVVNIVIPLGRTEDQVRETLKRAAIEIGKRERARATEIKAFRPDDSDRSGIPTIGYATYAPGGEWGKAPENIPMAVSVDLNSNSVYFHSEEKMGSTFETKEVLLVSKDGKPINISRERDSWSSEDIIVKVAPETKATIIETYKEAFNQNVIFTRHMVSLSWKGKKITGWVHGWDVKTKE